MLEKFINQEGLRGYRVEEANGFYFTTIEGDEMSDVDVTVYAFSAEYILDRITPMPFKEQAKRLYNEYKNSFLFNNMHANLSLNNVLY